MTILSRPKLMILGEARHGKDTVGEWFVKKGYTFVSSSRFVGEKAAWPVIQDAEKEKEFLDKLLPSMKVVLERQLYLMRAEYVDFEHCFEDRASYRGTWYELISAYNRPDAARLGKELFAEYDMYVGLRSARELHALRMQKAFDLAIWVDASERCPPEPESSCSVKPWMADVILDNNGTLEDLDIQLEVLYNKWIAPLEQKRPTRIGGFCPACNNQARPTPCPVCNP